MLVYDPDGNEHDKDPVDARECVKHCGYSYEPVVIEETAGSADDVKAGKPAKAKDAASDEQNPGSAA